MNQTAKHTKVARKIRVLFAFLGVLGDLGDSTASAAEPAWAAAQDFSTGLKNPRGVAARPDGAGGQYEIFVAESGAGRVVKLSSGKSEKREDAVTGFATRPPSYGVLHPAGVQSLQFLDHMRLVVAGTDDDGKPFVRLYELPESNTPLIADQHKQEIDLPLDEKESPAAVAPFLSLARTDANDRVGDALIFPAAADHNGTRLVFVPVRAGALKEAVPLRLSGSNNEAAIGGIAVAKSGYIVVAAVSVTKSDQSSVLEFVNPLDRRVVMQVPIALERIVALAYNPKSGDLYAANSPASDDDQAGIYRIDAGKQGALACTAVKVANVRNPTALAFGPDGILYVTSPGNSDSSNSNEGVLLKLVGVL